ncbi:MAG: ABC transporter ATP-binding protein [Armatimonadetes bacterium]|nr:ABC transporter ATP-binding protein [Armatimonadota bacterium]
MIRLEKVSKIYRTRGGEVRALDEVDLTIERGEFVTVRGPSGSGKSTLLLTVGGMVHPTQGKVFVDDADLYALSAGRRGRLRAEKIGFVFQMFHLLPYLTAVENVLVPALAGNRVNEEKAIELLEYLKLGDRVRHRPAELSTGERQRVALARALIKDPEILLADEPTGNLDPDNAHQVMEYFADFHKRGGTVLVVTHDPVADEYADRLVLLEAGRIVENP